MRAKKNMVKFIISSILKSLIFALIICVAFGYIMGYKVILVKSGSAEPDIRTRSIILIKKIDPVDLKIGDYITFEAATGYITHRIVDIDLEEQRVYCSDNQIDSETGKYNMEKKQTVLYKEIVGKVIYTNYILGTTIWTIRGNMYILVGLLTSLMLLLIIKEQTKTEISF